MIMAEDRIKVSLSPDQMKRIISFISSRLRRPPRGKTSTAQTPETITPNIEAPEAPPPLLPQHQEAVLSVLKEKGLPGFLGLSEEKLKFLKEKIYFTDDDITGYFLNGLNSGGTVFHFFPQVASQMVNSGYPDEAIEFYEIFLKHINDLSAHLEYLNCCLLSLNTTNESLFKATQDFAHRYEPGVPADQPKNNPDPERRLKIGFICGFFDSSVMRDGMLPTISGRNPNACETYCYSDGPIPQDFLHAPDHWRETGDLTNDEMFDLIRADGIDIIRDLNGPTGNHCLDVFLRRPAPIAIHGANYKGTFGLSCFDWVFASEYSIKNDEEIFFSESVYRGNAFYGASVNGFVGSDRFPPVPPPPVTERGYVTFGYFGGAHKLNRKIFAIWGQILDRLPSARIVLKAHVYAQLRFRNAILQLATDAGLDINRLELREPTDFQTYIAEYADIDIVLDATPHSGGASVVEALWMGRPVISLYGNRWAGRSGAEFLRLMGREELIALSAEDYVEHTVKLASDPDKIVELSQSFRAEFSNSPLADIPSYNRQVEAGYRTMWRGWCAEQKRRD